MPGHRTCLGALGAALMLSVTAAPTAAGTISINLFNGTNTAVTSFKVKDARLNEVPVAGFRKLPSEDTVAIEVTLPGRECNAYIYIRFANGVSDSSKADFCWASPGMAFVAYRGNDIRFLSWQQARAMGGNPR